MNTTDWNTLFEANPGPPGEYFVLAVALFAVLLVAGIAAVIMRRQIFPRDALRAKLTRRFGWYAVVLGAIGLALALARYAAVPGLSTRFLMIVALAAVPALAAYTVVYFYSRYPRLAKALKADQLEHRYATSTRPTGPARRAKKRRRNR